MTQASSILSSFTVKHVVSNGGLVKWFDTVFIHTNFIYQIYTIIVDNLTLTVLRLRYIVLRHSLFCYRYEFCIRKCNHFVMQFFNQWRSWSHWVVGNIRNVNLASNGAVVYSLQLLKFVFITLMELLLFPQFQSKYTCSQLFNSVTKNSNWYEH